MVARDSVAEDMATKDLVIERVFDTPRERLFDMFTKAEHLQKWWGPKGVGIGVAEFDARPGGQIFFAEHSADGAINYIVGAVREIEPPSRLVYAMYFANEKRERVAPPVHAGLGNAWDGEIISKITFVAEGQRTRVTIVNERSGVTAKWAKLARLGWGESLDKLDYAIADDMKVAASGEREILITRTFNVPRALVYEALTKAEHIKRWWGPRQYGTVSAQADFRPGGHYRYAQRGPDGEVAFSGEVRESSPERIVYVEEFEAMPGHASVVTVTLDERGGKTLLTMRGVYQSKEDRDAVIDSGMEWGARLSYLQLDEVIDSLAKAA